ncbi:hypothetical protein ACUIJP_05175 [Leuconostoc pseudomesenteroides]|uniref:hypothetical protein n=1 Tax=Leuconostoc pseudomesenteroides TaxID=33968 RepID=UPI00403D8072
MIKITKITQHFIHPHIAPKNTSLDDLFVANADLKDKKALAAYVIETYSLGQLISVKFNVADHILDFTYNQKENIGRVVAEVAIVD